MRLFQNSVSFEKASNNCLNIRARYYKDIMLVLSTKKHFFFFQILTAVMLLTLLISCNTLGSNYLLTTKYIILPDSITLTETEVLEGIGDFLVSRKFLSDLNFQELTIETEWQIVSAPSLDAMKIFSQINNITAANHNNTQYFTEIKYYFIVSANSYSVYAEVRVIDKNKAIISNKRTNNVSKVQPNSEFWRQMHSLAQETNHYLDINRYNLVTERRMK